MRDIYHHYKIRLDDERLCPDSSWTQQRTPADFVHFCCTYDWMFLAKIDEISFDHDLGCIIDGKEITGYDLMSRFLATWKLLGKPLPKITIHSANPAGRERMERLLEQTLNK